jgi:GAF domain-containing protein
MLLGEVANRLAQASRPEEFQSILARAARRLVRADGATFVLRDGDKCFYVDEDAVVPLRKGERIPLTACISGWVMLNRQSTAIPDIYGDPRIRIDAYEPTCAKSLAVVPIRVENPLGAIGTYWSDFHVPTEEEVALVASLAEAAATAIEADSAVGEPVS